MKQLRADEATRAFKVIVLTSFRDKYSEAEVLNERRQCLSVQALPPPGFPQHCAVAARALTIKKAKKDMLPNDTDLYMVL